MGLTRLFTSSVASAKAPPLPFRIIIHPDNPHAVLSRHVVSDMFLKKTTRWEDGEPVHPYDQRPDSDVRRQFSDAVLQRSIAAVRHYWQQRIFSGRDTPPPELDSDEAVLRRVQGDRAAVGYVSERATVTAVTVVKIR
jgi:ABC-type phosphate transport system substrate-binding protein